MKRLWSFITAKKLEARYTAAKEFLFERKALRVLCYLLISAAILVYWLHDPGGVVGFVYNAF